MEVEKMLRKISTVIVLMSLMPVTNQAGYRKSFDSILFSPQKRWTIPVTMDIGMYVEILDIQDLSIKLKQVGYETFEGCTEFGIKTNFELELGCRIKPTGLVPGDYSCWIDNPKVHLDLSNNIQTRKVCVRAENVKILHTPPLLNGHVADVTITILPDS